MKTIYTLILTLPFLLISCGQQEAKHDLGLTQLLKKKDSLQKEAKKINQQLVVINSSISKQHGTFKLTNINVAKLESTTFEHFFPGHADVIFDKNVTITPELAGELKRIYVTEGQKVRKGQALFSLDLKTIDANIKELRSNLSLAKKLYKKNKALYAKRIVPEVTYLQTKTNYDALQAKLKVLLTQRSKAKVVAPFSGVIDEIFAKEGEVKSPGLPILRLINDSDVYAKVMVSERYIDKLQRGTKVLFKRVTSDTEYVGKISFVSRYINSNNRSFVVHIDPMVRLNKIQLNPNEVLNVNIRDVAKENSLVVPSKLVQTDLKNRKFVYTISTENRKKGEAQVVKRFVKSDMAYRGDALVIEGLKEGEYYITKGAKSVQSDEVVKIKGIDRK